nr:probable LRR receptor-like serine/threonine-protein kinase At4g36180 [Quercus suber]
MREGETLKTYSYRYWEMYNEIDGDFEDVAIRTFKVGLPTEHELRKSLTMKYALNMCQMMGRTDKYKRVEEDQIQGKEVTSVVEGPSLDDQSQAPKKLKMAVIPTLGFLEEDKMGTLQPHDDALVVTIRIGGYDVKWVLVDQGSRAKIMYLDLYRGNKESDCCEWKRVKCNITSNRIIQLALNSTISYWSGESGGGWYFNAYLFLPFEELQYLDLSNNFILRWVPNEALSKLEVLHLDSNNFNNSILSSLSGIASLKELYLGYNNLNGSIPIQGFERFSLLSKLEVLHLDGNNFNHSILQSLSGIASLKELDLSSNKLNGSIHIKEFKAFSNLEDLDLRGNEIDAFVTTRDSNILTKLQLLDLSGNDFSVRVLDSLTAFPSLKTLDLSYNNLAGSFIAKELSKLNNLEQLKLDGSSIDKSLLHKIGVMTSLNVLAVSHCGLNSTLPERGSTSLRFLHYQYDLRVIYLPHNEFAGQFPN